MLSYALVSRQGKSLKKAHSQNKKKENTADTAHLLNPMGVRVPVHAFQSSI